MMFFDTFTELLKEYNISMAKFAQKTGIPKTTISGWKNQNKLPDYNAIIKISDFFNISTDYLLGRENEDGTKIYKIHNSFNNNNGKIHFKG